MKKLLTTCSALVAVGLITFMTAGCDLDGDGDDDTNGGGGGGGGTNAPASLNSQTLTITVTGSSDPYEIGDTHTAVIGATTLSFDGDPDAPYTWTPSGDTGVLTVTETFVFGMDTEVIVVTLNITFTTTTSGTFAGTLSSSTNGGPPVETTVSGTFIIPST
jgi:hypothetical protein